MSYFDNCKVKFLNISGEDLPDEEYFKRQGISNSSLKRINPDEGGSPQLYLNPPPFEFNPSLILGSAFHQLVLQSSDYELSDYDGKPSGKCGVFVDYVFNYRQKGLPLQKSIELASSKADYFNGMMTKNRIKSAIKSGLDYYVRKYNGEFVAYNKEVIVLPQNQLETCKRCLESFNNSNSIQSIIGENIFEPKEYLNEIALFSDVEVTLPDGRVIPLKVKGKFDSVVLDPETKIAYLNDVKTTSRQIDNFMDIISKNDNGEEIIIPGTISIHHYYRQLGLYSLMLQMYLDHCLYKSDYDIKCNIFAVETTGSNRAAAFRINNSYIQKGLREFKELICRVAYHEVYGYNTELL